MAAPGRPRGLLQVGAGVRRRITFPEDWTMRLGDRVYGIDSSRSSVIQSFTNQHRREVEYGSLKSTGAEVRRSPLAINPLNDAWLAGKKSLAELEAKRSKSFKREYERYKSFIETITRSARGGRGGKRQHGCPQ